MNKEQAKLMYPNSKDWQFEPYCGVCVGDRVSFKDIDGERMEGTVHKFWRVGGDKLSSIAKSIASSDDSTVVRLELDDGTFTWRKFWDTSKVKPPRHEEIITPVIDAKPIPIGLQMKLF